MPYFTMRFLYVEVLRQLDPKSKSAGGPFVVNFHFTPEGSWVSR